MPNDLPEAIDFNVIRTAAAENHVPPELLTAIIDSEMKDGKFPEVEINDATRKFAAVRGLTGNLGSPENQWILYVYSIADETRQNLGLYLAANLLQDMNIPVAASNVPALQPAHQSQQHITTPNFAAIPLTSTSSQYRPSAAVVALNERYEGFVKIANQQAIDRSGVISIGYGHTNLAAGDHGFTVVGRTIGKEDAEKLLISDLTNFGGALVKQWPGLLQLPQGVQDACVTYAFGCGPAALMRSPMAKLFKEYLVTHDPAKLTEGAAAFANGIHTANGKPLLGLVRKNAAMSNLASSAVQLASTGNQTNLGGKVDLNTQPSNAGRAVIAETKPAPVMPHPVVAPHHIPAPAPIIGG